MTDKERLDFLDLLVKTKIPVGIKPAPVGSGVVAVIGDVYVEGADSVRDLLDKIKNINDGEVTP